MNVITILAKHGITIERAYTESASGREVKDGFDVFINGNWGNRYALKRDAVAAVLAGEPAILAEVKANPRIAADCAAKGLI